VLHEQLVILTIETRAEPIVPRSRRVEIIQLGHGFWRVIAFYGFMETPNVPDVMRLAGQFGLSPVRGRTSFYLGRETFVPSGRSRIPRWRKALFVFMARNARSPTDFYGIPPNGVVELGAQIQI
jgi:KUP system potassium uptake protein